MKEIVKNEVEVIVIKKEVFLEVMNELLSDKKKFDIICLSVASTGLVFTVFGICGLVMNRRY